MLPLAITIFLSKKIPVLTSDSEDPAEITCKKLQAHQKI